MASPLVRDLINARNERLRYFFQLADRELEDMYSAGLMPLEDLIAEAEHRREVIITSERLAERIASRLRAERDANMSELAVEFRADLETLGKVRPSSMPSTVTRRFREFISTDVRPLMADFESSPESRRGQETGGLRHR